MQDERVDATTRGFLGLTVACAQCHNHKFDPSPQMDYYSLQGVFSSSELNQAPLAPKDVVEKWDAQKKAIDKLQTRLKEFIDEQTDQLGAILASQTSRYMLAIRQLVPADDLDRETLDRWTSYLANPKKDYPHLNRWSELVAKGGARGDFEAAATDFQTKVEAVNEEKHLVDEKNKIKLGLNPSRNDMSQADLFSLPIEQYNFWRDLFSDARKDAGAPEDARGVFTMGAQDRPFPGRRMEAADGIAAQGTGGRSPRSATAAVSFRRPLRTARLRAISGWRSAETATIKEMWCGGICRPSCAMRSPSLTPMAAGGWNWPRASPIQKIRLRRA
jgi:hypothetical protein